MSFFNIAYYHEVQSANLSFISSLPGVEGGGRVDDPIC